MGGGCGGAGGKRSGRCKESRAALPCINLAHALPPCRYGITYAAIRPLLLCHFQRSHRVLHLGVGSSGLQWDMAADG